MYILVIFQTLHEPNILLVFSILGRKEKCVVEKIDDSSVDNTTLRFLKLIPVFVNNSF